jgi:hypothetical protein
MPRAAIIGPRQQAVPHISFPRDSDLSGRASGENIDFSEKRSSGRRKITSARARDSGIGAPISPPASQP